MTLFGPSFARGQAAEQVSDEAWLQGMLDAEAALAVACAEHGLIPKASATAIKKVCVSSKYDADQIGRREVGSAMTPVDPLVDALRDKVGEKHAEYVHFGASDQDIMDTAMMLVVKRALAPVATDLLALRAALGSLADEHRLTPMIGRSGLRQTDATTFGLKAASWFSAVSDAAYEIVIADESGLLAAQLGGATGTLAEFGDKGLDVAETYAQELGLADPYIAWHTARNRPADVASALAIVSGVLSKVALDVSLMAQSEVGEIRDPGGAAMITAIGKRVPALAATIFAVMAQEHEQAAGAWQAEWETLSGLIALVGAQVAWARELIEELELDSDRMALNLEGAVLATGGDPTEIDVGSAPAIVERLLAESLEE